MTKGDNQKLKLMYLAKILLSLLGEETDVSVCFLLSDLINSEALIWVFVFCNIEGVYC